MIELRRYSVEPRERASFARYFETYFPEAFQQLGAIIFGHFLERGNPAGFTWIRGFRDMESRRAVNEAFYEGPVWKDHAGKMNSRMTDHTNVLLLEPVAGRGIPALPAVDPVCEWAGAQGIVVAQIFVATLSIEEAEEAFAKYRAAGIREAGILTTLNVPNNFPRLPVRTDGPYLVWLGIAKDEEMLQNWKKIATEKSHEALLLDPTSRSRLRWL